MADRDNRHALEKFGHHARGVVQQHELPLASLRVCKAFPTPVSSYLGDLLSSIALEYTSMRDPTKRRPLSRLGSHMISDPNKIFPETELEGCVVYRAVGMNFSLFVI